VSAVIDFTRWLVEHNEIIAGAIAPASAGDQAVAADELAQIVTRSYWPAWQAHPDFRQSTTEDDHNPAVVGVWCHPAYQGHSESFVIARLGDVLAPANVRWGARSLGEFQCVRPVLPTIRVSATRITYISWSLKGSGQGFRCRQLLKGLLPAKYHTYIVMARRIARNPKTYHLAEWLLDHSGQGIDLTDRRQLPDWYNQETRDRLNYFTFIRRAGAALIGIEQYVTAPNFWRIATGQVHPDVVHNLLVHQPRLFLGG